MLKTVFSLAACSVLLTLQSATAQEEDWDLARLRTEVKALKTLVEKNATKVDQIDKSIEVINENTQKAMELNLRLTSELEKLASKEDLQSLSEAYQDQAVRNGQILDALSADDAEGNRYLRLDSIMENSEAGRSQFRSAVEKSVRPTGTLTLVNKVGADRVVIVNGQQQQVLAGATLTLEVPSGTVNTRLPSGEEFNWTIGPANQYSQSIDILERQTTYRPITQTSTSVASASPAVSYTTYYNPGYTASYTPSYSTPYYSGYYSGYTPNYYAGYRWGRRGYSYYAY